MIIKSFSLFESNKFNIDIDDINLCCVELSDIGFNYEKVSNIDDKKYRIRFAKEHIFKSDGGIDEIKIDVLKNQIIKEPIGGKWPGHSIVINVANNNNIVNRVIPKLELTKFGKEIVAISEDSALKLKSIYDCKYVEVYIGAYYLRLDYGYSTKFQIEFILY